MTGIEDQIRQAYSDESFQMPVDALRSRRRRHRALTGAGLATAATGVAAAAVLGAVGVLGAGGVWSPGGGDPDADGSQTRVQWCDRIATEQLRDTARLPERDRILPRTVVTFSDQDEWMNVYVSDRLIVSCFGSGDDAEVSVDFSPMLDPDAVWLPGEDLAHLSRSIEGGQSFVLLATPVGTERAEVVLTDGTVVPAEQVEGDFPGGDRFIAWLPRHPGLGLGETEEQTFIAYTPDTVYTLEAEALTSRPR